MNVRTMTYRLAYYIDCEVRFRRHVTRCKSSFTTYNYVYCLLLATGQKRWRNDTTARRFHEFYKAAPRLSTDTEGQKDIQIDRNKRSSAKHLPDHKRLGVELHKPRREEMALSAENGKKLTGLASKKILKPICFRWDLGLRLRSDDTCKFGFV